MSEGEVSTDVSRGRQRCPRPPGLGAVGEDSPHAGQTRPIASTDPQRCRPDVFPRSNVERVDARICADNHEVGRAQQDYAVEFGAVERCIKVASSDATSPPFVTENSSPAAELSLASGMTKIRGDRPTSAPSCVNMRVVYSRLVTPWSAAKTAPTGSIMVVYSQPGDGSAIMG